MTEREQFEAAMCQLAEQPESSFEKPYDNDDVNAHWAVWQASRRAALEEAARVCDEISADYWRLYKGRPPYTGSESGRADPHVEGKSDGAEFCANGIRALSQKTVQGEKNG